MFRFFDSGNLSKPYFCVIHCNGYKCFVFKEHGVAGELLKTTIEFIYQVEEINYLIGVYELESTSSVSKLWFGEELLAERVEQSGMIDNYLPVLCWCTKLISDCWFREVCFSNSTDKG